MSNTLVLDKFDSNWYWIKAYIIEYTSWYVVNLPDENYVSEAKSIVAEFTVFLFEGLEIKNVALLENWMQWEIDTGN